MISKKQTLPFVLGGIGLALAGAYLGLRDRFEALASPRPPSSLAQTGDGAAAVVPTYPLVSGPSELLALDRGRSHLYELSLEAGEYLSLVAEQDGIDVELRITLPGGEELPPVDSPTGTAGEEHADLVSQAPGTCRIEVFGGGGDGNPPSGRYRLRIAERRPATPEDRRHASAERLFHQGRQRISSGNRSAAVESFLQAAQIWDGLEDWDRQAEALFRAGRLRKEVKEHRSAAELFERALGSYRLAGNSKRQVDTLSEIGNILFDREDFVRAEEAYHQALLLARDLHYSRGIGSVLTNLGNIFEHRGERGRARSHFHEALAIWRTVGDAREQVISLNSLGFIALSIGDINRALEYYEEAVKICEFEPQATPAVCADTHNGTAEIYLVSGDHVRAEPHLALAVQLRRQAGNASGVAVTQVSLGRALLLADRLREAMEVFQAARETFQQESDGRGQSLAWNFVGRVYLEMENPQLAEQSFHKARNLAEASEYSAGVASALTGLARTENLRGNPRAAVRYAADALSAAESLRAKNGPPDFESFFEGSRYYYDLLINMKMALQRVEAGQEHASQTLLVSERARARALLEVLSDPGTAGREPAEASPQRHLEKELELARALTLQDLQRELGAVSLLEYHLLGDQSLVWRVHRGAVQIFELPSSKEIGTLAAELLDSVQGQRPSAWDAAERLSRAILPPGLILPEMDRIAVVLDGGLQGVPFGILIDPKADPSWRHRVKADWPQPLFWKREIVQLPSVSVLAALRRLGANRQPASHLIAILADPVFDLRDERAVRRRFSDCEPPADSWRRLMASYDEAKAIESLIPAGEKSRIALGFEARLDLITAGLLQDFQILHFSTHAFGKRAEGEPGIVLSLVDRNGCGLEGVLHLRDLYRGVYFSRAELAVLSACETGLGREVEGEGLVGLAHGFLSAGVPRVIASLWTVDDYSSADLMRRFYRKLLQERRPPIVALAAAQREMLESAEWSAPYHWGGFVLQGDWLWAEPLSRAD
jgi:CHAT domain-containing protein